MTIIERFTQSQKKRCLQKLKNEIQFSSQPLSKNAQKLLQLKKRHKFSALGPDLISDDNVKAGSWNAFIEAHIVDITTGDNIVI